MREALNKLRKLRGRSLDEFRVRGVQAANTYAERRGWSAQVRVLNDAAFARVFDEALVGRGASAESLLDHFRKRQTPRFFAAFDDSEMTRAGLRRRSGEHAGEVIERAERIGNGRFDLLGFRDLYFGEPVDWHLEPVSGKRSPLRHWSQIDELDVNLTGDKKITWELNRHQHFLTLGRAYWRTRDERYAQTFVTHVNGWMDANPPKVGINWASSLEVSFRAIAWLWALYFFKDSPNLAPPVYLRVLKFLYLHGRHLETYLSTYFSPNTHLTGEALGLFYLGTVLPEFRRAARWRALGRHILVAELDRHVRPDGVYFEQTSYYHRYTADFYMHLYILGHRNGELIGGVKEKLTALLDHLMYITRPDGTTPFFGDDDGGRLAPLGERAANDFRATLSTGAALFARPDYKYVAGGMAEETLWLLGGGAFEAYETLAERPPADTSRAFADGGYYVMRDEWTPNANYLLMDCGPHGTLNCGHAHADALAFDMAAGGRTLLVDPGTYSYTNSSELRDFFRGSVAHNTLTVDGKSSSEPGGFFDWKHIAESSARVWMSRQRFDYFEGEHNGYTRLASPAMHNRSLLFVKGDYWIMRDRVMTTGTHRYDIHFHFTPDANPALTGPDDDGVAAVLEGRKELHGLGLFAFARGGTWQKGDGWVSDCYGKRSPAPVYVFSKTADGPQEFITFLIPRGAHFLAARVCEVATVGGGAFEVFDAGAHDLIAVKTEEVVETARVVSDFDWSWARLSPDLHEPRELILLGGRRFSIDGREVFSAARQVGYFVARLDGDELLIDTDARGDFTVTLAAARRVLMNNLFFTTGRNSSVLRFVNGRPEGSALDYPVASGISV